MFQHAVAPKTTLVSAYVVTQLANNVQFFSSVQVSSRLGAVICLHLIPRSPIPFPNIDAVTGPKDDCHLIAITRSVSYLALLALALFTFREAFNFEYPIRLHLRHDPQSLRITVARVRLDKRISADDRVALPVESSR